MPKRLCPFECVFAPQRKTHVGEKEITSSMNGKSAIANIHERTLQKLYQGAKTMTQLTPCICGHEPSSQNGCEQRYTQLRLGSHGELVRGGVTNGQQMPPQANTPVATESKRCTFCEVTVSCLQCQRTCHNCHNTFCTNCCLDVFRGCEDDASMCLSCMR